MAMRNTWYWMKHKVLVVLVEEMKGLGECSDDSGSLCSFSSSYPRALPFTFTLLPPPFSLLFPNYSPPYPLLLPPLFSLLLSSGSLSIPPLPSTALLLPHLSAEDSQKTEGRSTKGELSTTIKRLHKEIMFYNEVLH